MSNQLPVWDDRNFQKALRGYLDWKKNVDPTKELRRRAKNIGMRLIKIYKEKGVVLGDITAKVKSLGDRVKIRPKIRAAGKMQKLSYKVMIARELAARKSAKGFTATGWFPSVEKLGGNPKDKATRTGPRRGTLIEKLPAKGEMSETLVNQQPGAAHVQDKAKSFEQQALDLETLDMLKYITDKQNQAAKKNGLT